jgi:deazaflavin-dependent oxidoreductase (nitroreductase family)
MVADHRSWNRKQSMTIDFSQQIIEEFRANGGRVSGPFEGARLLLLTTAGARTGVPHTTPLGYLPDGGERILVITSAGGAPKHPDWFHNVVVNPRVTVEDGVFTYEAQAVVLAGAERDRVFARAAEADQGWADYQAKTTRVIPVVALRQVAGGGVRRLLSGISRGWPRHPYRSPRCRLGTVTGDAGRT